MAPAGFIMLGLVAIGVIGTGLPAFVVLLAVSLLFGMLGVATGSIPLALLSALPARVIGLLENDLLQALPLYALMGILIDRLPLGDRLFNVFGALLGRSAAAPLVGAVGLGAVLAPMNGSVGASAATLARIVTPKLRAAGTPAADGLAAVCVASTFGVVVPPSLVLILLSDAMVRAHTEAINATGQLSRVVNTQDIFRGALGPSALLLGLCFLIAWLVGRRCPPLSRAASVRTNDRGGLVALIVLTSIIALLVGVISGRLYAVEAAATGAVALLAFGLLSGQLRFEGLCAVLRDAMALTGVLFALLLGATSFTLVFRAFGTDRVVTDLIAGLPAATVLPAVLLLLALSTLALDAFEIIFVIVPVAFPPLLTREPDAVWVAVLALLTLQTSFLLPPIGYAVMVVRNATGATIPLGKLFRSLLPFLAAQAVVLVLTLVLPGLTHLGKESEPTAAPLSDEQIRRELQSIVPPPGSDE